MQELPFVIVHDIRSRRKISRAGVHLFRQIFFMYGTFSHGLVVLERGAKANL